MKNKLLKFFAAILFILGIVALLRLLTMDTTFENFVFGYSVVIVALTNALTLMITIRSDYYNNQKDHQAMGEYIPSRDLDKLIHDWYKLRYSQKYNVSYRCFKTPNYTTNERHAKRLLNLLPDNQGWCIKNTAKRSYTCTYTCKDVPPYIATSASREMAISIAFLKSCDGALQE